MKYIKQVFLNRLRWPVVLGVCLVCTFTHSGFAAIVTNLKATYSNGQVFLTWTNPSGSNLQYNVYRSTSKFTKPSQLKSTRFLGFVRDNSSKNIHVSMEQGQDIYYKIKDDGQPLANNQGLYVVTCTDNQSYYYAVTVTALSTGLETKTINSGKNCLAVAVTDQMIKPVPVFQDSVVVPNGDVKLRYVQFGNNQETSLYPALNSTGSYGFNFYLVKRGNAVSYPLMVLYEGEGGMANDGIDLDPNITDCYVLGVDDWLPIPGPNGSVGDNSHFCCYHENFNIYSNINPVPVSGMVKTYPQRRYIEAIHWAENHLPIDKSRVYTKGTSATGFGALLTAAIIPEEIAAAYTVVEPLSIGTNNESVLEQMWGIGTQLQTDISNSSNGELLTFGKLSDLRKMIGIDQAEDLPLIFDVHGKNDHNVSWTSGKIDWYDSLQANHAGGILYWDQRQHDGTGKNFISSETTPDFFRYSTNKSYPAFTNCSINQNPGNGSPNNGDKYGAINGYLDWEDDITDNTCDYAINVMVKDFYVGGVLDPEQYSTCKTDITFRRLQNFHPATGDKVTWKNYDNNNVKIQSGSFNYTGGLMTIPGLIVNKTGNSIQLTISNCMKDGTLDAASDDVYFARSNNGYTAHVTMNHDDHISVSVYDMMGRMVEHNNVLLFNGSNTFEVPGAGTGIFLVVMKGNSFSHTEKLLF